MEGSCPQCQARQLLPETGMHRCLRCGFEFDAALARTQAAPGGFPGPPISADPPASAVTRTYETAPPGPHAAFTPGAAEPELRAPCAIHPGNLAERVCDRCGDFICRLCTTPVEGHAYCPRCFDLLYQRGSLQFVQRQFNLPGVTLTLGICALLFACLCFPLGVLLGVGGIVTGTRALKEYGRRPDLPDRKLTVTGLGLSIASLFVGAGVLVWVVVSVMRA